MRKLRTIRRQRALAVAVAVMIGCGVVAIPLAASASRTGTQTGRSPGLEAPAVATVQQGPLSSQVSASGTLGYGDPQTVYSLLNGTITWLPRVGQVIVPGQTLYRVLNKPVTLFDGTVPAYRNLSPGISDGPDIKELNRNLVTLGFDPDHDITIDDKWQDATTEAVERWQASLGQTETGTITLGQVVFLPGAQQITKLDATPGTGGGAGARGRSEAADMSPVSAAPEFVSFSPNGTTSTSPTSTATTTTPTTTTTTSTTTTTVPTTTVPTTTVPTTTVPTATTPTTPVPTATTTTPSPTTPAPTATTPMATTPTPSTTTTATTTTKPKPGKPTATRPKPAKPKPAKPKPATKPTATKPTATKPTATKPKPAKPTTGTPTMPSKHHRPGGGAQQPSRPGASHGSGRHEGPAHKHGAQPLSQTPHGMHETSTGRHGGQTEPQSRSRSAHGTASGAHAKPRGGGGPGATPVLQTTSTRRQAQVQMDASDQANVKVGDSAEITLPDNQTTPGIVTSIGAATGSSSGTGSGPTIPITLALRHPQDAGTLDDAPVQVQITSAGVKDALIVPVDALLALSGGRYAVEAINPSGSHRLVPVTLGLINKAESVVQVSARGLSAGQQIVVPAT